MASLTVKRRLTARHPDFMPAYRIGFNTIAVLGLLPILWLLYSHPGSVVWSWSGTSAYVANCLALAALAAFFYCATSTAANFLVCANGSTRPKPVEDQECFYLTSAYRFVRHPWYFFSLAILWTKGT